MPAGLALGACRDGGGAWRQRAVDATVGRIAARDQAGGRLAHGPAGERRLAPFLRRGHTRCVAVSVPPLVPAFSLRRWLTFEQGGYRTGITPPAILSSTRTSRRRSSSGDPASSSSRPLSTRRYATAARAASTPASGRTSSSCAAPRRSGRTASVCSSGAATGTWARAWCRSATCEWKSRLLELGAPRRLEQPLLHGLCPFLRRVR